MKTETRCNMGSRRAGSPYSAKIRNLLLGSLIMAGMAANMQAQDVKYSNPSWWFGFAAGANLNFYQGSTQKLNLDLTVPAVFHEGSGAGLYLAPLIEFYRPDTRVGLMLQAGYDNRKGTFKQITTPCNCPADLAANVSYITIEPSLRIAPFKSAFYLYGGPRFAFNAGKSFKYQQGINPDFPDQIPDPEIKGDFSKKYKSLISMQIGAGIDIELSAPEKENKAILSPYVSFHPYFYQDPRSIETWNITTVRLGATLKFGKGHIAAETEKPLAVTAPVLVMAPVVTFSVLSPLNIPVDRRVRETFPVRNYVYFDERSAQIPERYVLITKDQVKDFSEDRLEVFTPKNLSGRSQRQMTVYYNVMNILGARMVKYPATTVRLDGANMDGKEDGLEMAESVKEYLVSVFGIAPSRITTEGRIKPRIPSEQPGGVKELELLRQGDRRVSIFSESPEILMEYQTGPDVPLRAVEILSVQEAPVDSYLIFIAEGAEEAFTSWSLEVRDENDVLQKFGPYTQERAVMPGKSILGTRPSGNYKVTMVGLTKDGKTITQEVPVHMVLWAPSELEQGMRFSVIFEFGAAAAISVYEKYLTEVVTPKIPQNGTVIIHGHTDIIGDEAYNTALALSRANEVSDIIKSALSKAGRTDVKLHVYGFGEDDKASPFENRYPEERAYNRTVIIDIIPAR